MSVEHSLREALSSTSTRDSAHHDDRDIDAAFKSLSHRLDRIALADAATPCSRLCTDGISRY
ncbi:MAG: hypothetical protein EBS76_10060, partial [Actinobacteria bacterium]|nr:hypothetical protein [Actinomycetota bacterium]